MSSVPHSAKAELQGVVKATSPDSLDGVVARHLLDCVDRFGEEALGKAAGIADVLYEGYRRSLTMIRLNDAFRCKNDPKSNGQLVITSGVEGLGKETVDAALSALRNFDDFTEANDPHHEHDFGSFKVSRHKFFWKIDYYDLELKMHSTDPTDPEVTRRVLTLMLAEEY
jgi:hypothetical protein